LLAFSLWDGCGSGLEPTNRHSDVSSMEGRMSP
jgi:hypothetical protein